MSRAEVVGVSATAGARVPLWRLKLRLMLSQLKQFLRLFLRCRKGVLGVGIIAFFSIIAVLAPHLTPYDPIMDKYLAGDRAMPYWAPRLLKIRDYSYDVFVNLAPSGAPFKLERGRWILNYTCPLRVVSVSPEGVKVEVSWSSERPGVLVFKVRVPKGVEEARAVLLASFNYPFEGHPKRFTFRARFMGVSGINGSVAYVGLLLADRNGTLYRLWDDRLAEGEWVSPGAMADSYYAGLRVRLFLSVLKDPARIIFAGPGNYSVGLVVEIREPASEEVVFIAEGLQFMLYGNAWGWLGTDAYGRDIFTQLIYGTRVSLIVGLLSALFSVVIGLVVGLVSGYVGGKVDEVLMRFTDMLLVIPGLPLLLVLAAVLGTSIWNLIILLGLLGWMGFARVIRSQVLSLKERAFVEAAKAVGASTPYIIIHHILPNVMSLAYVALALSVPGAIVAEAALSFLGLYDPNVMSWGRMLHDLMAEGAITDWWWVLPPGLCIALLSLSFIFIGYAIDELLNPRLRRRR